MSKITERGQITLPKKIRDSKPFIGARAVLISEQSGTVTITPIKESSLGVSEQHATLDIALHDWLDEENDNLFELS